MLTSADRDLYSGAFMRAWELATELEAELQLRLQAWLGLGLILGLGLWPEEPETLGNVGSSMFPKSGVGNVGKSTELVAAAL